MNEKEEDRELSPEEEVVKLLAERSFSITTAESCTGGLVSAKLVNVPGASEVLNMSVVTYSNEAKHRLLGVREETLEQFGAVSPQTAYEMADGALKFASADVSLSVTGMAGPGGGTDKIPVGLVYIGCNVQGNIRVEKHLFSGDRLTVRECSARAALALAKSCLLGGYNE